MDSFNTSDVYLKSLANQLGCEWRELATNLGFRSDQVDRICMDYPHTTDRIYAVLTQWRNCQEAGVDMGSVLENALKLSGRHDLADNVKEQLPPLRNTAVQSHHQPRQSQPMPAIYLLEPTPMILQAVPYPIPILPYQTSHPAGNYFIVYRVGTALPYNA